MRQEPLILIVDDDPAGRDTVEAFLLGRGYQLAFAADGIGCLAQVETMEPDLVLLDVMMPGMDGFEVCQHLKGDDRWRHIPVILVTALDRKEDLARGLDAGADDFLHKPVSSLELRARVRSMLRTKSHFDALQASLRLREDLAHMIVHDMRTPLTTIVGFSDLLLRRGLLSSEGAGFGEKIREQAQRLNSFLNDLLMVAKAEEGKPILIEKPVDVNEVVAEVTAGHRDLAEAKGIELVLEAPDETRSVHLDSSLFQRMLDNLLSNAVKFSPADSKVVVQVEYTSASEGPSSRGLRVRVVDQGPGVPLEYRDRLFDKYEVLALKERGVPQVGLGLAFCRVVAAAHGGRIWVEDNYPKGAVFVIEL
jgi:two-component system, sensor histidine kinase and response regulator